MQVIPIASVVRARSLEELDIFPLAMRETREGHREARCDMFVGSNAQFNPCAKVRVDCCAIA
jgi:hypothetical protein